MGACDDQRDDRSSTLFAQGASGFAQCRSRRHDVVDQQNRLSRDARLGDEGPSQVTTTSLLVESGLLGGIARSSEWFGLKSDVLFYSEHLE